MMMIMAFEIFLATGVFIIIMFIEKINPDSPLYPSKKKSTEVSKDV